MSNTYNFMTPAQRVALAQTMLTVLGNEFPNDYGTTEAQSTILTNARTALNTSLQALSDAKAAYHSAVDDKDADDATILAAIANIAATVYANSAVTPQMISALGLAPRSTSRAKIVPQVPQDLVANAFANGDVKLSWSPGTNKYGVVYVIESQEEGGEWTQIYSTTRRSVTLSGYTPGVAKWFRVKATKNGQISSSSNEVSIYHSTQTVQLSLAA